MAAAVTPMTTATAALGYLFAVQQWNEGILLNAHHSPGRFADENGWDTPDGLQRPAITEDATGWTIEWPLARYDWERMGEGLDLLLITVHVTRDGTIRRLAERTMARGTRGVRPVANATVLF